MLCKEGWLCKSNFLFCYCGLDFNRLQIAHQLPPQRRSEQALKRGLFFQMGRCPRPKLLSIILEMNLLSFYLQVSYVFSISSFENESHVVSRLISYSYFLLALKESSKEKAPKNPTEELWSPRAIPNEGTKFFGSHIFGFCYRTWYLKAYKQSIIPGFHLASENFGK